MRQPRAAAVAGGCGATTVAAAIGLLDLGVYRGGGPCEVLVCRDTVASVGAAHRAVHAAPGRPVLVVVASTPSARPRAATARLEVVRPHVSGCVAVPFVARWRELTDPHSEAAAVLRRPQAELPKHLRRFAEAMAAVQQAVTAQAASAPPVAEARPAAPPPPNWGTSPAPPGSW